MSPASGSALDQGDRMALTKGWHCGVPIALAGVGAGAIGLAVWLVAVVRAERDRS